MKTRQIPQREYAQTIRSGEYNRKSNNCQITGIREDFDMDLFCGRKSKVEVQPRKPKTLKDETVS